MLFGAFVVVVFGGITVYGNVQENYIPKLADIDSARIAIDLISIWRERTLKDFMRLKDTYGAGKRIILKKRI